MNESVDTGFEVRTQIGPFALVPVWVLSMGLTGSELAVYIALRSYANGQGEAHPYVKTLARRAGVVGRTAERALARFRELGLMTSQQRWKDREIIGNTYWLRDVPNDLPPPGGDAGTPPGGDDGDLPPTGSSGGDDRPAGVKELTSRTNQRTTSAPSERRVPTADATAAAQTVVGEWIDWLGERPPDRVVGQVAKLVGEMLREGISEQAVRQGPADMSGRGLNPATLPSLVHAAQRQTTNPKAHRGKPRSTTDERVQQAIDAGRRVQAMVDAQNAAGLRAVQGGTE